MSASLLKDSTRALLADCDQRLYAHGEAPRSLAPPHNSEAGEGYLLARTPGQLCELLLEPEDHAWGDALARGLCELARAQRVAFPENIYGDLDFVAASILRQGRSARSSELVTELCERMCGLQALYGQATAIRFRYVHDFSYGYDWAKWVRRELQETGRTGQRTQVGPFDLTFLKYMHGRGHELLELIARDDAKYPDLRDLRHRNPFPFSREPAAEMTLLPQLAREALIPVETWKVDASPVADRDFAQQRVACAARLGLLVDDAD